MLKDIPFQHLEGVGIAAINEEDQNGVMVWNVYLINYSKHRLTGVFVSSQGWGMIDNEERKTSQLRHFLDTLEPLSYQKIEPIPEELFGFTNQYWFSAFVEDDVFEGKYVFAPGSISSDQTEMVSLINQPGVLLLEPTT